MTTKIQQAINHIFAHPGVRTDDLAKAIGVDPHNVYSYVKDAVDAGLLVTCKVARPGKQSTVEFRPSARAPEKAPDWKTWKRAQQAPVKPLKLQADPRRTNRGTVSETPAGGGVNNTGSSGSEHLPCKNMPEAAAVDVAQAGQAEPVAAIPTTAPAVPAPSDDFELHLSNDGRLHIFLGDPHPVIKLSTEETRRLGKFLIDTEPAWA